METVWVPCSVPILMVMPHDVGYILQLLHAPHDLRAFRRVLADNGPLLIGQLVERGLVVLRRTGDVSGTAVMTLMRQAIANLQDFAPPTLLAQASRINFSTRLFNLAWRMCGTRTDAEDLLQEIFLLAYRKLPDFRGESAVGTWLYRLAMNRCLDHLKSRQTRASGVTSTLDENQASMPVSSQSKGDGGIDKLDLERAIARLPEGRSLWAPRSACPTCAHPIAWYDNVPVVSFLLLRRRCRACGAAISWRYPAVELLTAAAFGLAFSVFGPTADALVAALLILVVLTAAGVAFVAVTKSELGADQVDAKATAIVNQLMPAEEVGTDLPPRPDPLPETNPEEPDPTEEEPPPPKEGGVYFGLEKPTPSWKWGAFATTLSLTVAAAVLGALSPDIDSIVMPFGWDRYLRVHEIGTHTILGTVACGLLTAAVVRGFARSKYATLAAAAWTSPSTCGSGSRSRKAATLGRSSAMGRASGGPVRENISSASAV